MEGIDEEGRECMEEGTGEGEGGRWGELLLRGGEGLWEMDVASSMVMFV